MLNVKLVVHHVTRRIYKVNRKERYERIGKFDIDIDIYIYIDNDIFVNCSWVDTRWQ